MRVITRIAVCLLALILMGALNPALGQELLVHGVSSHRHGDTNERYNNYNLGLGIRTDTGLVAGAYYNSYRKWTAYVGQEWMPVPYAGVFAAVATGYDTVADRPVTLIGGLLLRGRIDTQTSVDLRYLPRIKDNPEVIHLGFGLAF